MTEFEIASDIMNLVTSNEGVTNSRLRIDQIMLDVDSMRLRMIAEAEKGMLVKKPYQGFGQRIKSVKVTRTSTRSLYLEIPKIYLEATGLPAIGYIGSTDRTTPFRIVTGMHTTDHDEFIAKYPTVHYSEGLLTFKNTTAENIAIYDTIFEDPSALEKYGEYNAEVTPYPLTGVLVDMLIGKVAGGYLNTMYRKFPQPNTQTDIPVGGKR